MLLHLVRLLPLDIPALTHFDNQRMVVHFQVWMVCAPYRAVLHELKCTLGWWQRCYTNASVHFHQKWNRRCNWHDRQLHWDNGLELAFNVCHHLRLECIRKSFDCSQVGLAWSKGNPTKKKNCIYIHIIFKSHIINKNMLIHWYVDQYIVQASDALDVVI